MPVKITKKPTQLISQPAAPAAPAVAPWDDLAPLPNETLLQALDKFKPKGPRLFIIQKSTAEEFEVLVWEGEVKRVTLMSKNGIKIKPMIGPREDALYYPVWR